MRATEIAKDAVAGVLGPGDFAIDATAGNGHDTLFLCGIVGAAGKVLAFDIQKSALSTTRTRLSQAGIEDDRLQFIHSGHETMAGHAEPGSISAIMFNLGYLPGGDKRRITRTQTTLAALNAALPLLQTDGVLSIVCYPGHVGGDVEATAVRAWAEALGAEWKVDIQDPEGTDAPFAIILGVKNR